MSSNTDISDLISSAEQGDAEAQLLLGLNYSLGDIEGIPQDDEKAVYWLTKAAEQGNADAQFEVAGNYLKGLGVDRNWEKVNYWLNKAAEQGHEKAQESLNMFKMKMTYYDDSLNKSMFDLFIQSISTGAGDSESMVGFYDNYIKENPNRIEAYLSRGELYTEMGEYQKALADFEKAMSIDSNVAESYNRRGVLFANSGDIDKALDDFSKAIKLNAKHAGAYTNRASIYLKKRDIQKAISDCTKAIELAPYAFEPYYNRGLAYMNINEPEKALEDYSKVIELSPKNAEAYAKRGLILSAFGNVQEAISDYEKFLELDPDNEKATLVRDAIDDLKKSKIPGDTDGDAQERKENAETFKEEARKGLKFLIIGGIAGIIIMAIIVAMSEKATDFASGQEMIAMLAIAVVWSFGIGSSITSFAAVWSMIWKASNAISNYFIRICRFFTDNRNLEEGGGCVIFWFTLVFVVPWLFFGTVLICPIITIVRFFKLKKQIKQADEEIEFCKRFL